MVPTDVRHGVAANSKVFRLYGRIGLSAVGALIPLILDVFSLQRRSAAGDGCLIAAGSGNIVIDGKGHIFDKAAGGRRPGRGAVDRRVVPGGEIAGWRFVSGDIIAGLAA